MRFPAYYFGRSPGRAPFSSNLAIEPFQASPTILPSLSEIDKTVLAHGKSQAAAQGRDEFSLEVPLTNQVAVDYLLQHRFRMCSSKTQIMHDAPSPDLKIISSPAQLSYEKQERLSIT